MLTTFCALGTIVDLFVFDLLLLAATQSIFIFVWSMCWKLHFILIVLFIFFCRIVSLFGCPILAIRLHRKLNGILQSKRKRKTNKLNRSNFAYWLHLDYLNFDKCHCCNCLHISLFSIWFVQDVPCVKHFDGMWTVWLWVEFGCVMITFLHEKKGKQSFFFRRQWPFCNWLCFFFLMNLLTAPKITWPNTYFYSLQNILLNFFHKKKTIRFEASWENIWDDEKNELKSTCKYEIAPENA